VARYADEWNGVALGPDEYARKVEVLERHCEAEGRDPATIRRSMMTFGIIGPTEGHRDRTAEFMARMFMPGQQVSAAQFRAGARQRGLIGGSTDEVLDQLGRLAELGLQEVQFQHLFFESDDVPEYLAAEIAPQAARL
jgi:alkanesulfonate monooxygenase SsuD/methylene tetrahydromethanopterin reductase-like flavin-dependent oxidoreductase (luciferase family)